MSLGPGSSELTPSIIDPPRMPARVDTVRRQFDRRAARFGQHDCIVPEVGRRLIERLQVIRLDAQRIVDVGCGAGGTKAALLQRYAQAHWLGVDLSPAMLARAAPTSPLWQRLPWRRSRTHVVCAEAAALPIADGSVDPLFSNLMLHWHPQPHTVFPEWLRVLRVEGLLLFSCFGPDTLKELRTAFAAIDDAPHVNQFIDMHDLGDAMVRARLADPVMDMEMITITYQEGMTLMRDLKVLGAHNVNPGRNPGLTGRARLSAVLDAYEQFRNSNGLLPASYEVLYGHAWRALQEREVTPPWLVA